MKTKSTPDLETFKKWAKDCAPAGRAVLLARAFAELERERVDAYILPIFKSYKFTVAEKNGRRHPGEEITEPRMLYLSDDEVMCAAYYEECDRAHRAHGFKGPHGHCPALTAEHLVIQTEHALIGLAQDLFGVEAHQLWRPEDRKKYLDLLIGACLQADPRPIDPRAATEPRA